MRWVEDGLTMEVEMGRLGLTTSGGRKMGWYYGRSRRVGLAMSGGRKKKKMKGRREGR